MFTKIIMKNHAYPSIIITYPIINGYEPIIQHLNVPNLVIIENNS